ALFPRLRKNRFTLDIAELPLDLKVRRHRVNVVAEQLPCVANEPLLLQLIVNVKIPGKLGAALALQDVERLQAPNRRPRNSLRKRLCGLHRVLREVEDALIKVHVIRSTDAGDLTEVQLPLLHLLPRPRNLCVREARVKVFSLSTQSLSPQRSPAVQVIDAGEEFIDP